MEITPTITTTNTTTTTTASKSSEPDPTIRIQPIKPLPFTNGVLKRHSPHLHHHVASPLTTVTYKECLKNHAASLGTHALDGCGEFMPSPTATPTDPTSLKCAACGCHRNFHRRDPEEPFSIPTTTTTHVIEYQPHHRHHPPPPLHNNRSPNSASPPPISSSYYPSAPHMLLALSAGLSAPTETAPGQANAVATPSPNARKRFRTKFSHDQREKMYKFAERVGWKMQKREDELVHEFCNEIGIDKGVLKVWMHNNKNTLGKKIDVNGGNRNIQQLSHNNINNNNNIVQNQNRYNDDDDDDGVHVGANGSSSSS